ncbi:hypothetical protein V6N13_068275 [Hibiscus sabdariffa]
MSNSLPYSSFHEAYGNDEARGRSSHSKSPGRPYAGNSFNNYDGHNRNMGACRTNGWDTERRGSDLQSGNQFEFHAFPQTLDEFELEYKREAMELGRIHDKEEDEENYKHHEVRYFTLFDRQECFWILVLNGFFDKPRFFWDMFYFKLVIRVGL